ncbi:MAG: nodulation protein NfeD [Bacteroidales bacterium]|jgi:membrane-bound serine protease (ClpP class)|nr:nodulation protein NfeD [Bacteroidales bacterium]
MRLILKLLFLVSIVIVRFSAFSQDITPDTIIDGSKLIYQFDIQEEIAPPVWHKTKKAFVEANALNAELILINMNTYGGHVDAADSIRTRILNCDIPVYVFINNNAASAGALIAIACDSIYMIAGSNIGAATVVNQSGEAMPDKYQSYMRSMMRSTAEATGRDPQIAQAMVDPRIVIPRLIDSTMVLTFTPSEAIANGFCEAEIKSIPNLLNRLQIEDYKIEIQELKATDRIIRFLINPMVSSILVMMIVGGIYLELQSPGIGFPIAAAFIGAILYFAPHYIEGLVEHWEIIVFIIGVLLLAVEIFVIPGFGVSGILGIIFIIGSLALATVRNIGFNFELPDVTQLIYSLLYVSLASLTGLVISFYLTNKLFGNEQFKALSLMTVQKKEEGFSIKDPSYSNLIDAKGIAQTILRPSGRVKINNRYFDAVAKFGYIEKGEKIMVVGYGNAQLIVMKHVENED